MRKIIAPIAALTLLTACNSTNDTTAEMEPASGAFEEGGAPVGELGTPTMTPGDTANFTCDFENPCDFDFVLNNIETSDECFFGRASYADEIPDTEGLHVLITGESHNHMSTWDDKMGVLYNDFQAIDDEGFTEPSSIAHECNPAPDQLDGRYATQGGKVKGQIELVIPENSKKLSLNEIRSIESYEIELPGIE